MASALAAALFLSGYEAAAGQTDKTAGVAGEQNIIIHMNETVSGLLERTPSTFSADCLQPAKVCWYKFRKPFSSGNLPSVTVMDGVAPLIVLDDTAGITIVIDQELGNEIRDISFSVKGLPDNTLHSANKDNIYRLIQGLMKQGWDHMYHFPAPRIPGDQAAQIANARSHSLAHPWFDPRYEASLEHWIKFQNSYHWHFHKNGYYLNLKVRREDSETEPLEAGTYLTSLELMTEESYWRKHFEHEQKVQWKELLPELLEQYRRHRANHEEQARAAGIRIEHSYRDPYIHVLANRTTTEIPAR